MSEAKEHRSEEYPARQPGEVFFLGSWVQGELRDLRQEIRELRQELKGTESSLRKELKDTENALRKELKDTENALRQELRQEILALRKELKDTESSLRQELKQELKGVRALVWTTIGIALTALALMGTTLAMLVPILPKLRTL
ncbi:hypothetical protein [Desulfovirgula thermocuniculi]|uniref:hypothetical protein n=1 Tax=Desulfovirgula thermocuniculi TaxID=348842 RepID=UPI000A069CA2|nr:hypothetical protein [Desulfovirgula thermocuniculi]